MMPTHCCVCGVYLAIKEPEVSGIRFSHGYCKKCADKARMEIELDYWREREISARSKSEMKYKPKIPLSCRDIEQGILYELLDICLRDRNKLSEEIQKVLKRYEEHESACDECVERQV